MVTTVYLTGWRVGLRKVSLTKLLCEYTGCGLTQAKALVDSLLKGESFIVHLSDTAADTFFRKAMDLGAICHLGDIASAP